MTYRARNLYKTLRKMHRRWQINTTMSFYLDRHAPLRSKTISPKPPNPWMTPEIVAAKRQRRYLERTWRKQPTSLNRTRLTRQTHLCNRLMSKAKSAHYSELISENSGSQRSLWNVFNKILHRRPEMHLPKFSTIQSLADTFGSYFVDKISIIRSAFPSCPDPDETSRPHHNAPLQHFSPATEDEVRRFIVSAPCKSSDLDPIPTSLLKPCLDILIAPITSLINLSLSEGRFPSAFKTAHVTPLLKKPKLPKDEMKNYRPVSNLSFISKILEKVVASRVISHVQDSNAANPFQSAYRKFHSTETALLKIHSDILKSMDEGRVTALTLLDLSAAFDTIDHAILLKRLENWFGITHTALDWLTSYLTDRSQQVKLHDCLSSKVDLPFGVPQGSVLGPLLFTLYTTPLSQVISDHSVPHHLYADDSQLYVSFASQEFSDSLEKLQSCLSSVQRWMLANKLKLNPDKTEFLLIGHEQQRKKYLSNFPIQLMDVPTASSKSARNLGVVFDQNFNLRSHVSMICRSCLYHIRDLRRIRRHLSLENAKTLASALVTSRLDYCNSLLHGIAEKDIMKLQRIQNRLARVVTKSPRFTRSIPLLRSLHWLPIKFRCQYKICVLSYKALNEGYPAYLCDLLVPATAVRTLRSGGGVKLKVPRVRTKTGSRAFRVSGPVLWNSLPLSVTSASSTAIFRKRLKTLFFDMAFPP